MYDEVVELLNRRGFPFDRRELCDHIRTEIVYANCMDGRAPSPQLVAESYIQWKSQSHSSLTAAAS